MGDLYSEQILGLCKVDLEERIRYYNLAKKSYTQIVRESSIDRLMNIYYKVFMAQKKVLCNLGTEKQDENNTQVSMQSLTKIFRKVLSLAGYLNDSQSLSVYHFYFQYYLKGENFESVAEHPPNKAVRKIDNVLIAR